MSYEFLSFSILRNLLTFVQRVMVNVSRSQNQLPFCGTFVFHGKIWKGQMQNVFDLHGAIARAFTSLLFDLQNSTLSQCQWNGSVMLTISCRRFFPAEWWLEPASCVLRRQDEVVSFWFVGCMEAWPNSVLTETVELLGHLDNQRAARHPQKHDAIHKPRPQALMVRQRWRCSLRMGHREQTSKWTSTGGFMLQQLRGSFDHSLGTPPWHKRHGPCPAG